jgi:hypothetical protein
MLSISLYMHVRVPFAKVNKFSYFILREKVHAASIRLGACTPAFLKAPANDPSKSLIFKYISLNYKIWDSAQTIASKFRARYDFSFSTGFCYLFSGARNKNLNSLRVCKSVLTLPNARVIMCLCRDFLKKSKNQIPLVPHTFANPEAAL